ncbi:hypothetical protein L7F22_067069 [Adiantum nelumboides]|nr:hypothetical protein [Adiantum nelumboides]
MEKAPLKGETMYYCFVDFKKAFDTVPRHGLWSRMETIGVPIHLRVAVAHLYHAVRCKLKMQTGFSKEFFSTIGVKQGCPLSPTLFGLCIDELEDFIYQTMQDNGDAPNIGLTTLLLLIYADDVVLLAHSMSLLQKLLDAVHTFCEAKRLSVNVLKTKCTEICTHKSKDQPAVMYDGQEIQAMDSFKYLGIIIPSNHRWGQCAKTRIEAGQARHMGIKTTTPYSMMLLETRHRPLEMLALQRMHRYLLKVKLMPHNRLPHIAWEVGCKPQKNHKSKFLTSSLVEDIKKWFSKWNIGAHVDMHVEAGTEHEHELDFELQLLEAIHSKWKNAMHRSKLNTIAST